MIIEHLERGKMMTKVEETSVFGMMIEFFMRKWRDDNDKQQQR